MPAWVSWALEELTHIKEFWKTALVLCVLVGGGTWAVKGYLERTQRSNLESEISLLKSQVQAKNDAVEQIKAELDDRNEELKALKTEQDEMTSLKAELKIKTDEVTALGRELRAQTDEVKALKNELKAKEDELVRTRSELKAAQAESGPLPTYSLGGSNVLVYESTEWTTQDTARKVELDWNALTNIDANAVLRIRTEGEDPAKWAEARIVNLTNGEVVATTHRHQGKEVALRFELPRATGTKIYSMQIRGDGAGLDGTIELVRTKR